MSEGERLRIRTATVNASGREFALETTMGGAVKWDTSPWPDVEKALVSIKPAILYFTFPGARGRL